jgi:hypothetical protein
MCQTGHYQGIEALTGKEHFIAALKALRHPKGGAFWQVVKADNAEWCGFQSLLSY